MANRTRIYSTEELIARREALAAGRPWPPIAAEHLETRAVVAELEAKLDHHANLRRKLNPAELRKSLEAILEAHGVEPAEELIKMATERNEQGQLILPPGERLRIWSELLQYRMPKLKSTEMSGQIDHTITVVVRKFGSNVVEGIASQRVIDIPSVKKSQ
jgi:hypothetical protein